MSTTILAVYETNPGFPAQDQHPSANRAHILGKVVDFLGDVPTADDVDAYLGTPAVPTSVPMWKAKAALAGAGKLTAADAAVAASGNTAWQLAWEYAPEISRNSAAIEAMAAALSLSETEVDALFIAAAAITV